MPDNNETGQNSLGCLKEADYQSAKIYDQNRFQSRRMQRQDNQEKAFTHYVRAMVKDNVEILDVPCGNGRFFEIFRDAKKLILADYSGAMLTACRERIGDRANVQFIQADICALPLADCAVDLSFCMRLFHHMKTDDIRLKAMQELARVSRSYVALSFYNKNCLRYYRKKLLGKKISGVYVSFSQLLNTAKQAGLECVYRTPRLNVVEQQCMVIFRKK